MTASPAKTIRAFAPASVSNVACGFDTLGFATSADESLGDIVTASLRDGRCKASPVTVSSITGDDGRLPQEAERNTAAVAAAAVLDLYHQQLGENQVEERFEIELQIEKRMPLCSGLGSSAASAVAGTVATYELLRRHSYFALSESELVDCALAGEVVASGGRHADNVAPCLLGGFVLVRCLDQEPDVVRLPDCDDWLWTALARPSIDIDTHGSRQRMGDHIELPTAVKQWANVGALVAALYERDEELLSRALVDHVAEPARKSEVAGFDAAIAAALDAGALGGSLSGSGPTLFALATSAETAQAAAAAMASALSAAGHSDCAENVSPVGTAGARVLPPPESEP